MTDYEFTTDPDERWAEIEDSLKYNDCTRKEIRQVEKFFATDPPNFELCPWTGLSTCLQYTRVPSLNNLQLVIDEHAKKYGEVSQKDIYSLQLGFSRRRFHLNLEDCAYLFKQMFGETYDKNRCLPLKINDTHPEVCIEAASLFDDIAIAAESWIDPNWKGTSRVLVRALIPFFDSLLPLLDKRVFGLSQIGEQEDFGLHRAQSIIRVILKFSHLVSTGHLSQDRCDFLNEASAVIRARKALWPEFDAVDALMKEEAEKIKDDIQRVIADVSFSVDDNLKHWGKVAKGFCEQEGRVALSGLVRESLGEEEQEKLWDLWDKYDELSFQADECNFTDNAFTLVFTWPLGFEPHFRTHMEKYGAKNLSISIRD